MRPRWPTRSATIRCNRIAYWNRKEIFGICWYLELPCRPIGRTAGRMDGQTRTMLNAVGRQTATEQSMSQVRRRCDVYSKWRLARSTDLRCRPLSRLVEPGEFCTRCSNFYVGVTPISRKTQHVATVRRWKHVDDQWSRFHIQIQYRIVTDRHDTTANTALMHSTCRLWSLTEIVYAYVRSKKKTPYDVFENTIESKNITVVTL